MLAASEGARLVCMQELTLSPYFAITPDGPEKLRVRPESLEDGPTIGFARSAARRRSASTSMRRCSSRPTVGDGLGFNTAMLVAPDGELVQRTRKLHIPVTAGYYEDRYFRPGPASGEGDPFPVVRAAGVATRSWGCRPAGISGSPSSPAPTRWLEPRC